MDHVTRSAQLPLASDYTRFLGRHRRRIAVTTLLGVLGGLALALAQPSTYSATASVALVPVPVYVAPVAFELAPPQVSIDTDAQLLRSPDVLQAVGDALGVDAARSEQHLSVTAAPGTNVLHVTVRAGDPRAAATAAGAAATALVAARREMLGSLTLDQIRQLRFLVVAQESRLAREQSRRVVVAARDDEFAELLELRTRLAELEDARRVPGEVIAPPPTRGRADYPNTEVPLTSGAALGVLLGCLAGAARDRSRGVRLDPEETDHVA